MCTTTDFDNSNDIKNIILFGITLWQQIFEQIVHQSFLSLLHRYISGENDKEQTSYRFKYKFLFYPFLCSLFLSLDIKTNNETQDPQITLPAHQRNHSVSVATVAMCGVRMLGVRCKGRQPSAALFYGLTLSLGSFQLLRLLYMPDVLCCSALISGVPN